MKVTLLGAASGEVTGSSYLVESGDSKVLVDFGMFQGVPNADQRNRVAKWYTFRKLNSVLVTHAHLDHTGRLPILAQRRFAGSIFCTEATADLSGMILRDAARIQENDVLRVNRHRQREAKPGIKPLYSPEDVENVVKRFQKVEYDKAISVAPGIEARWIEAGHLLGSASIQLTVEEEGKKKTVVFSGDLGPSTVPFTRSSDAIENADIVFLESTYGDREHRSFQETAGEFAEVVRRASELGGKILVPTFAVGRAQLMVVLLAILFRRKEVPPFPVYLDSPMAIEAGKIYMKYPDLWHDRLKEIVSERPLREELEATKSKACITPEESRALNETQGTCMILAGAGMCNAGRILHHLRNNLWKPETSVLVVGYQGSATVGRALVDGAKDVRIFNQRIAVRAAVHSLGGFSAHAGQSDLLSWLSAMAPRRPRVFLTHGEDRARKGLAACIEQRFGIKATLPGYRDSVEL
jgi:metallo-beta-lactamase family protein